MTECLEPLSSILNWIIDVKIISIKEYQLCYCNILTHEWKSTINKAINKAFSKINVLNTTHFLLRDIS